MKLGTGPVRERYAGLDTNKVVTNEEQTLGVNWHRNNANLNSSIQISSVQTSGLQFKYICNFKRLLCTNFGQAVFVEFKHTIFKDY